MRPVQEGGSSSSSGPAVPEEVEESWTRGTATGHAVFGTWCRECCIGRGPMHQHRAAGRQTAIPAIAVDCVQLNDRVDQLQAMTRSSNFGWQV